MKINILLKITFIKQGEKEQNNHFKTKVRELINEYYIGDYVSASNNEFLNRISVGI